MSLRFSPVLRLVVAITGLSRELAMPRLRCVSRHEQVLCLRARKFDTCEDLDAARHDDDFLPWTTT